MPESGLRVVHIEPDDWTRIETSWRRGPRFRHVVRPTEFSSVWRVTVILSGQAMVGLSLVRRFGRPGMVQDGLEFKNLEILAPSLPWAALVEALPATLQAHVNRPDGRAIPPRTANALEEAIIAANSRAREILEDLRNELLPSTVGTERQTRAREQHDATALGLEMGGLDSRALLRSPSIDSSEPFIAAFNASRNSEARAIRHDFSVFDEWISEQAETFDTAHFVDPDDPARKMTVLYADKEPLETQSGTDLLYYRHHRPGFILVQYKRLRAQRAGSEPTYFPDEQLETELERMRALPESAAATTVSDWRLLEDSFFVKVVSETVSKPAENRLVRGMYLPLSLIDLLIADAKADRRPIGWSVRNLSEYLSNDEFLLLSKQGFVGTRGTTTEQLMKIIEECWNAQRGTILALDHTDPSASRRLRHG